MWTELRAEIMQISRKEKRWGDTSFLLGVWSGPKKDGEFSNWKPNLQAVAAAIRFAIATERLTIIEKDEGSNQLHMETPEVEEVSEEEMEEDTIRRKSIRRHTPLPTTASKYTYASHCQYRRCRDY